MQISRSQLHNLRSQTLVGERNANTKRLVNALKRMLTNDRRNFYSRQLFQHAKKSTNMFRYMLKKSPITHVKLAASQNQNLTVISMSCWHTCHVGIPVTLAYLSRWHTCHGFAVSLHDFGNEITVSRWLRNFSRISIKTNFLKINTNVLWINR